MNLSYYKPSGKLSAMFFVYFLLFLAVGIPVLSVLYIYLIHFIPIVYANLLVTGLCGAALGFLAAFAAKFGKARNPLIIYLFTFLGVVVMKYVQWAVYIPLIFSRVYGLAPMTFAERFVESFYLLGNPEGMFILAQFINGVGVWSFSIGTTDTGTVVNGVMLLIVWILEFILLGGVALLVASTRAGFPFSEEAGAWYTESKQSVELDVPEHFDTLRQDMEGGSFSRLIEHIRRGKTDPFRFLRLTIYQPPEGALSEPYFMTVSQHTTTHTGGKRPKEQNKSEELVRRIAVPRHTMGEITAPVEPPVPQETVAQEEEAE